MKELTKNEMLKYLEEINIELKNQDKFGEIVIAGGAALTLVFDARKSTQDIDALFAPTQDMRKIISNIAERHELPQDWLNDGVKGFVTDKMKFNEILSYSNLSVSSMDAESLLAMKLIAARVDTKDMPDSVFLMNALDIKNIEQVFEIMETYTQPKQQTIASKYFAIEAFEQYQEKQKERPRAKEPPLLP